MMILLDVFLMLSVVRYSLLLREVRGKGLIENDITDILLICQCGFAGTLRPLSHFQQLQFRQPLSHVVPFLVGYKMRFSGFWAYYIL